MVTTMFRPRPLSKCGIAISDRWPSRYSSRRIVGLDQGRDVVDDPGLVAVDQLAQQPSSQQSGSRSFCFQGLMVSDQVLDRVIRYAGDSRSRRLSDSQRSLGMIVRIRAP